MSACHVQTLAVGPLAVNCYVIDRGGRGVVIDPGGDAGAIEAAFGKCDPEAVLLSHSHYDHLGALDELTGDRPGVRVLCHAECARRMTRAELNASAWITGAPRAVRDCTDALANREVFEAGGMTFIAHHVPGHSPGQMVYYLEEAGALFSGDTVFAGGIGRSDLPGGNGALLARKCLEVLHLLPPSTRILPGHGPATTVERELATNPFLQQGGE